MQKPTNFFEMDEVRQLLLQKSDTFDQSNRHVAENLMKKLQNLSDQFKHLSEAEKVKFSAEMSGQFEEKLGVLRQVVDTHSDFAQSYRIEALQLPFCLSLMMIFILGQ
jgi:isopenicillin N synthase-like dioxygenase